MNFSVYFSVFVKFIKKFWNIKLFKFLAQNYISKTYYPGQSPREKLHYNFYEVIVPPQIYKSPSTYGYAF